MNIKRFLFPAVIGLIGVFVVLYYFNSAPPRKLVFIQVAQMGVGNIPCFEVEIENKMFLFGLDLGLDADLSGTVELTQQVSTKSLEKTVSMSGIGGVIHQEDVYRIPTFKLGKMTVHQPLLNEHNIHWDHKATVGPTQNDARYNPTGIMGWRIFKQSLLFLNLHAGYIALAGSLTDIQRAGLMNEFVKVPLITERGLLEFDAQTHQGTLRCVLDTGSTLNFIQPTRSDEQLSMGSFKIGNKNFGPTPFHPLSMKFPCQVEAMLGMEFFLKHQVLIDFQNKAVYFALAVASP